MDGLGRQIGGVAGGTNTRNAQHCQRGLKLDLTVLVFYCIHNTSIIGNQHAIQYGEAFVVVFLEWKRATEMRASIVVDKNIGDMLS